MGRRKRKSNKDDEEEIRRKIRKLEKKLHEPTRKRVMRLPSSSSDENQEATQEETEDRRIEYDTLHDMVPDTLPFTTDTPEYGDLIQTVNTGPPIPLTEELPGSPKKQVESEKSETNDLELEGSILSLLGEAPEINTDLGPPVHKDIAARWREVLQKGLKEVNRDEIIKNYPIPNNLDLLIPPILNPEVRAALPEGLVKRDLSICYRQKEMGVSLSALSKSMYMLICEANNCLTDNKSATLKPLSDACRLLCDLYQTETKRRRLYIISSINVKMKEIITDTVPGKYLFGDNICEKLKAAQSIDKSGQMLKAIQNRPFLNTKNIVTPNVRTLNSKIPYRRGAARTNMGRQRRSEQHQRQHQRAAASAIIGAAHHRRRRRLRRRGNGSDISDVDARLGDRITVFTNHSN
ncbi:uncharacterized protein LOC113500090 isoform X2 [Trichoplusia ni]|uniref:Uncharacterized protein LOC113500090 isoform X2 n=1 Tax=Trichoplusia ni TaxID=7111 RepID=A0A7E5W7G6_TRINI|nr:uncharacterized protein LOC113500090 isoform X2 [Trichoplusia ni]